MVKRTKFALLSFLAAVLPLAYSCGGGGGGGGGGAGAAITFTSDDSVILASKGSAYQLVASAGGRPITWSTSDATQVQVSPTGLVTAMTTLGSATITATASGAAPVTASVIVAAPGPQTVLVDSAAVQSNNGTQAVLTKNAATQGIVVGDIVVSGDKAGLIGKVQSVTASAQTVTVTLASASIVQAFPNLNVHLVGAPINLTVQYGNGRTRLIGPDGTVLNLTRGGFTCQTSSGGSISPVLSGPTISANVTGTLDADLVTQGSSPQSFDIHASLTIPAKVITGSVGFEASGQIAFGCTAEIPEITFPGPPIGPVRITGTLSPSLHINVAAAANGSLTLDGPGITDTFNADAGVSWTPAGGWQSVLNDSSTGPKPIKAGIDFKAQASGKVTGAIDFDYALNAEVPEFKVAGVELAFDEIGADLNFSMLTPLSYTTPGYTGPTWSEDATLKSGPELKLTGGISSLLTYFGLPSDLGQWALYNHLLPLGASPKVVAAAGSPTVALGSPDRLSSVQPASYAGSNVQFYAFPSTGGTPIQLGSATPDSNGVAVYNWTPMTGQDGSYNIVAFLFGDGFGQYGLPYPSNAVAVKAGGSNVGVGIH